VVIDYGSDYPSGEAKVLGEVTYGELKSGSIRIMGKEVPTAPLSSYPMARKIANILKEWIGAGRFFLSKPTETLPGPGEGEPARGLTVRPVK